MSKAILSAVVAAAVTAAAFLLNPSPEQHHAKLQAAIAERHPLASALGLGVLTTLTSQYHSLGIVSYTSAEDKTLSVGALGMVWVVPAEQK